MGVDIETHLRLPPPHPTLIFVWLNCVFRTGVYFEASLVWSMLHELVHVTLACVRAPGSMMCVTKLCLHLGHLLEGGASAPMPVSEGARKLQDALL